MQIIFFHIIFFGVGNKPGRTIVTPHGRTTPEKFGPFHGIDEIHKAANKLKKGELSGEDFANITSKYSKLGYLQDTGIRLITGIIVGQLQNGVNSLLNGGSDNVGIVQNHTKSSLGKNTARYDKYNKF